MWRGGHGNLAAAAGNADSRTTDDGNNNHRNNNRNNRNDWSAESVLALEQRVLQTDTASSGNGGVVTASGNGGVVSIGDINSGSNVGNAISVGDTHCAEAVNNAPNGGGNAGGGNAGGSRGGKVSKLPKTGVGMVEDGTSESLLLALGALGLVVLSHGYGYKRRVSRAGGR
jgi:hypothetical protein